MVGDGTGHRDDGIWDDGEWISWDSIYDHLYMQELQEEYPKADPQIVNVFNNLVDAAIEYRDMTGRHLPLFGELGELFAEIKYGIRRHRPGATGSDGKLGDEFVEVKTISPDKKRSKVSVKRAGHFGKLVVVKISANYEFAARMVDRKKLSKGSGKKASISWESMPESESEP